MTNAHTNTLAKIAPDDPLSIKMVGAVSRLKINVPVLRGATPANLRRNAVKALSEMAEESPKSLKQVLPYLIAALADQDVNVKVQAITALAGLGTAAREAIPALRARRFDESEAVRRAVTAALAKIQPDN